MSTLAHTVLVQFEKFLESIPLDKFARHQQEYPIAVEIPYTLTRPQEWLQSSQRSVSSEYHEWRSLITNIKNQQTEEAEE